MFNTLFYQPVFEVFKFIYYHLAFENLGLSVIFLTILVKMVLFPFFYKSIRTQILMGKLQPLIVKIQKDFKDDPKKQTELMFDLYRKYKINPILHFILLLLQFPIFIALYRVSAGGVTFFHNSIFLGFIDLKKPSLFLAVLTGLFQYTQGVLAAPVSKKSKDNHLIKQGRQQKINNMTNIGFALFSFFILLKLNAAIGLYWSTMVLTQILQEMYIRNKLKGLKIEIKEEEKKLVTDVKKQEAAKTNNKENNSI